MIITDERIIDNLEEVRQVDNTTGCWLYTGHIQQVGYGRFMIEGLHLSAHVWSAIAYLGYQRSSGLYVLHRQICPNRHCFNPQHLYLGSQVENTTDTVEQGKHFNAGKTHCPLGHLLDRVRVRRDGTKSRYCSTCNREGKKRSRQSKKGVAVK